MEQDSSPRKIQFTPHLDPEAAEQIRRRRPTPATLVLTSDQSSPEIDEDRIPNPHLKRSLPFSVSPELQMMVEHHLGQQEQGEEPEGATESTGTQESHPPGIPDTEVESRLGTSGTAKKPAESILKTQERGSKEPTNSVRPQGWAARSQERRLCGQRQGASIWSLGKGKQPASVPEVLSFVVKGLASPLTDKKKWIAAARRIEIRPCVGLLAPGMGDSSRPWMF
uniref:Protein phosphatase 1 regulatory subunit 1A n=1 Tax=Aotus nancymaae TaxID=37293 RepID=A0A2K5EYT6_AOTNA